MRALSLLGPKLTDPLLRKRGFVESRIVRDWPAIVGETLARHCVPLSISFPRGKRTGGSLELRVVSGLALEIQHRTPLLIERVNTHFGWTAVERIRIRQGALPPRRESSRRTLHPLSEADRQAVAARVETVADRDLRQRLTELGEAIAASRPAKDGVARR